MTQTDKDKKWRESLTEELKKSLSEFKQTDEDMERWREFTTEELNFLAQMFSPNIENKTILNLYMQVEEEINTRMRLEDAFGDDEDEGREHALPKDYFFCIIPAIGASSEEFKEHWSKNTFEIFLVPKYLLIREKQIRLVPQDYDVSSYFHDFGWQDSKISNVCEEASEWDWYDWQRWVYDGTEEEARNSLVKMGYKERKDLQEEIIKILKSETL